MPSTITTPVAGRVPNRQAQQLRAHAARFGLTISEALAVVVARGLDAAPSDAGGRGTVTRRTITRDGGICHVCGLPGADTVAEFLRSEHRPATEEDLVAAHQSCQEAGGGVYSPALASPPQAGQISPPEPKKAGRGGW